MSRHLQDNFKFYFAQAQNFERDGENVQASASYAEACKNLLKLAQESNEELKRERIERAKQLKAKSDALLLPPKPIMAVQKGGEHEDDETSKKFFPKEKPDTGFDDVAGLDEVKDVIRQNVIRPYIYPEHYAGIKQVRGAILYGPPGTGKTMIAKATAKEVDADFYVVKGSDIMSKWVGDAEKNIDELFRVARQSKLSVIFYDEFDALASSRTKDSVVRKSVIAALLAQIEGFAENENKVLVLAATNLPWDIDPALESRLRMVYIPLPDAEARKYIIEKAYEDFPNDFDIDELAGKLIDWNGRGIADFCEESKRLAAERAIEAGQPAESRIVLQEDIDKCFEIMPSALCRKDIQKFEEFRDSRKAKK